LPAHLAETSFLIEYPFIFFSFAQLFYMIEGTFFGSAGSIMPRIGTTVLSSQNLGGMGNSYNFASSSGNSGYGSNSYSQQSIGGLGLGGLGLGGTSFSQQKIGGLGLGNSFAQQSINGLGLGNSFSQQTVNGFNTGPNSAATSFYSSPSGIYTARSTTFPSPQSYSRTTVLRSDQPGLSTGYTSYSVPGYVDTIQPIAAISPISSIHQTSLQSLGGGYNSGLNASYNSAFGGLTGLQGIGSNMRTTFQTVPTSSPIINLNATGTNSAYGSSYGSTYGGSYASSSGSLVGALLNGK
jgi:hypothetical protein